MFDFGPTAFQRSGTPAPVLCSVTPTSLSSRARGGQQNKPRNTNPCFWRWPACRDREDCPPNPGSKVSSYADGTERRLVLPTRRLAGLGQATQNDQFCWVAGRTSRLFSAPWPPARPRTSSRGHATWLLRAAGAAGHARKGWLRAEPHRDRHPESSDVARGGRLVSTDLGWTLTSGPASQPRPPGSLGRRLARGLQGHAGQRGAVSQQLVLDLEIAGGGVCRAGFLVIEVAARHPGVRIRADGQPCLGHRGE